MKIRKFNLRLLEVRLSRIMPAIETLNFSLTYLKKGINTLLVEFPILMFQNYPTKSLKLLFLTIELRKMDKNITLFSFSFEIGFGLFNVWLTINNKNFIIDYASKKVKAKRKKATQNLIKFLRGE